MDAKSGYRLTRLLPQRSLMSEKNERDRCDQTVGRMREMAHNPEKNIYMRKWGDPTLAVPREDAGGFSHISPD